MSILVLCEHDNASVASATLNTVTAARALGDDVHLLVAGADCAGAAEEAAKIVGVSKVLKADAPIYQGGYVYLSSRNLSGIEVAVYRFKKSNQSWIRTGFSVFSAKRNSRITSFKMCKFHRDIDRDREPDVIVAWSESVARCGDTRQRKPGTTRA